MLYADYDFYTNQYFGKAIPEKDFPRLALCASQYIDYITQGKAAKAPELEAVKMACCALAEQYQLIEAARNLAVSSLESGAGEDVELQSQTVGGWSKSYRSSGYSAQAAVQSASSGRTSLLEIARQYLAPTGLLYRGGQHC